MDSSEQLNFDFFGNGKFLFIYDSSVDQIYYFCYINVEAIVHIQYPNVYHTSDELLDLLDVIYANRLKFREFTILEDLLAYIHANEIDVPSNILSYLTSLQMPQIQEIL
jgi:hypothetical protein